MRGNFSERHLTFTLKNFYSRPSARGDRLPELEAGTAALFLLTPLCEGRPGLTVFPHIRRSISTHAPLRGATCWYPFMAATD